MTMIYSNSVNMKQFSSQLCNLNKSWMKVWSNNNTQTPSRTIILAKTEMQPILPYLLLYKNTILCNWYIMWEKNKQQSKHYNNRNCFKSQFTLLWMLCKLYTELYTRKTVHKMPKSNKHTNASLWLPQFRWSQTVTDCMARCISWQ